MTATTSEKLHVTVTVQWQQKDFFFPLAFHSLIYSNNNKIANINKYKLLSSGKNRTRNIDIIGYSVLLSFLFNGSKIQHFNDLSFTCVACTISPMIDIKFLSLG